MHPRSTLEPELAQGLIDEVVVPFAPNDLYNDRGHGLTFGENVIPEYADVSHYYVTEDRLRHHAADIYHQQLHNHGIDYVR